MLIAGLLPATGQAVADLASRDRSELMGPAAISSRGVELCVAPSYKVNIVDKVRAAPLKPTTGATANRRWRRA